MAKRRPAVVRRGFFVIVPLEYRQAAAPPPTWFVDDLMEFHGPRYYVGLLSAAALYGAAHQQPQEFHVITSEQLRPAVAGRVRLRFFRKRRIERTATMEMKTETGTLRVSTPEETAFDLMRYPESSGHLGDIATVLAELAEKMEGQQLVEVSRTEDSVATAQRLGYLLERVGAGEVGAKLEEWIASLRPRFVRLRRDRSTRRRPTDARWRVIVNEDIETDV